MSPLPDDHQCAWREESERLRDELEALKGTLGKLTRRVFGKRSEKMPTVAQELKRKGRAANPGETQKLRKKNREKKAAITERVVQHAVPADKRICPKCGKNKFKPLGEGKKTIVYELIPARFEKQVHIQETIACSCGECILVAEGAPKVFEKGQYGPGFIADVVVSKCADSMPLYRLAKSYQREGVVIARTTLGDLFHAAARELAPLWERLLVKIAAGDIVLADETPIRVLDKGKTRKGYLWTFRTPRDGNNELIAYCFSPTRSGETPKKVLGNSKGHLVVDGYSGYNQVSTPEYRIRVGCWAHVRREFFDALPKHPEAQVMIDLILELYKVEYIAKDGGFLGSPKHLGLRQSESRKILALIEKWLNDELPKHIPKGPLGKAIRYAQNQWTALQEFTNHASLPLDNNASEGSLRVAAIGRKNFLFVGHDVAGGNLAGLYSLMATCEANKVNPQAYLADVLLRMQSHPASRLDELLPQNWQPLPQTAAA
jgi:transposase